MVKPAFMITCGFIFGALVIENKDYFTHQIPVPVAELPDAGVYEGKLHKGLFHGHGRIVWPSESYYEGDFEDGLFHGQGILHTPASYYEGDFNQGNATGEGSIYYTNGDKYTGEVKFGMANGVGVWETKEVIYKGEFKDNLYHGEGEITNDDGSLYIGTFSQGFYHGDGVFIEQLNDAEAENTESDTAEPINSVTIRSKLDALLQSSTDRKVINKKINEVLLESNEEVYRGRFVRGEFTGFGTWAYKDQFYEGQFVNWAFHGKGSYKDRHSEYEGEFSQGLYHGKGRYVSSGGMSYEGDFVEGKYSGKGIFIAANGDRYNGGFQYGLKHGAGTLTFAEALDGITEVKGVWKYGELIESDQKKLVVNRNHLAEHALYHQSTLLEQSLAAVADHDPEKIDLYFVGIAGDGRQGVFRREVEYVQNLFDNEYQTEGRSVKLVNGSFSYQDIPLATITSVEKTLQDVAAKMDAEKDILFVYLTSHGSRDFKFSLVQPGLSLSPLSAEKLGAMLKALPVRHKVVVISACFSGGFVNSVKDDNTMVITAAEADKASFGCHDRAKMTYFGEAFFKDSLYQSDSFVDAFYRARDIVRGREAKEGYENSNPLIFKPNAIVEQLKQWRAQMVNINTIIEE